MQLELHPPRLRVQRLTKISRAPNPDGPTHPYVVISSGETIKTLCDRLASAVSPDPSLKTPYRVWKVDGTEDDWKYDEFPESILPSTEKKLIEESSKTLEEEGIQSEDGFVVEFKQSDGWIVDLKEATKESLPSTTPLFQSGRGFFDRMGSSTSSTSTSFKATDSFYDGLTNSKGSSSSFSSSNSRGNLKTLEPGTLGLGNM